MTIEIGHIEAIFRYPVKSMAGGRLEAANLGWHGLDGDRRLAFRRLDERGGFPWLTASKLPDLIRFTPKCEADAVKQPDSTLARLLYDLRAYEAALRDFRAAIGLPNKAASPTVSQ